MSYYLDELYAHQEWADAEHWRAFEAYRVALEDKAIRDRLFHTHLVQHGFLWVVSPQRGEFVFKKLEDFPSMADLKKYGQHGLADLNELLKNTDAPRMEAVIEVGTGVASGPGFALSHSAPGTCVQSSGTAEFG